MPKVYEPALMELSTSLLMWKSKQHCFIGFNADLHIPDGTAALLLVSHKTGNKSRCDYSECALSTDGELLLSVYRAEGCRLVVLHG